MTEKKSFIAVAPGSSIVHRSLRSVHRGAASGCGSPVHRGSGPTIARSSSVGGQRSLRGSSHDGNAGPVDGDGLALGVELHTGRALGGILKCQVRLIECRCKS